MQSFENYSEQVRQQEINILIELQKETNKLLQKIVWRLDTLTGSK